MKHLFLVVITTLFPIFILLSGAVVVGVPENRGQNKDSSDAGIFYEIGYEKLDKKAILEKFFDKFNSPLKPYASDFVKVADKYNLDYKLLPSISCIESSCGKNLIPGSNNPFGWGIYGNRVTTFSSYNEAIETVGKGLKDNYISRGYDTPEEIAPIYTPPAHRHWLSSVRYFSGEITEIESQYN